MLRNDPETTKKEPRNQEATDIQNTKDYRTPRNNRGSYYPQRRAAKPFEEYAPLNRARVHILDEILQAGLAKRPPSPDRHYTISKIEELIRSGHLKKFKERAAQENKA
jgi:hypothetical protein